MILRLELNLLSFEQNVKKWIKLATGFKLSQKERYYLYFKFSEEKKFYGRLWDVLSKKI